MMRAYKDYINDLREAFGKIEVFSEGIKDLEDFTKDEKTALAIIKLLENIGEAAKNVPHAIKSKYPDVPWEDMAGMRDILIHEYFGIDYEVVWKTIKDDLPRVKPIIHQIENEE